MTLTFTNYFNKTRHDRMRRRLVQKNQRNAMFNQWVWKIASEFDTQTKDRLKFYIMHDRTHLNRRNESRARLVNRCIFTDNPHSVNQEFRLARQTLKEATSAALLTGLTQLPVKK